MRIPHLTKSGKGREIAGMSSDESQKQKKLQKGAEKVRDCSLDFVAGRMPAQGFGIAAAFPKVFKVVCYSEVMLCKTILALTQYSQSKVLLEAILAVVQADQVVEEVQEVPEVYKVQKEHQDHRRR